MTFEAKKATREGTPVLIGLWGPSGSGKTYSALLVSRGLVGPKGKIIVVDTENRRAKLYANLAAGWQHVDFQPPFTPARYIEAMDVAEQAGADVIIIDSMSHVWEGAGGVLDMADANSYSGLKKWQAPKMEYKRMMNALLRSRVHVIFCLRAKEKMVQTGTGKETRIVSVGMTPICEKNFIYEMTAAALLDENHLPAHPVKVPEDMAAVIQAGKILTTETGEKIAEWVSGGVPVDHAAEELRREARDKAPQGATIMRDWWQSLSKDQRNSLAPILEELKATASQADAATAEAAREESAQRDGGTSDDPLDDAFTDPVGEPETSETPKQQELHPLQAG